MLTSLLAKRYAQAILAIAKERDQLDQWVLNLDSIASVLKDEDVKRVLSSVKIQLSDKIKLLETILPDLEPLARNLVNLLLKKNRLSYIPDITAEYRRLVDVARGIGHAEVITAVSLSTEEEQEIKTWLSSIANKEVTIHISVNPEVIGGFVARIDGRLVDASIRNRLQEMRRSLIGT